MKHTIIIFSFILLFSCSNKFDKNKTVRKTSNKTPYYNLDNIIISDTLVSYTDSNYKKQSIKKFPKRVIGLYNSLLNLWYGSGGTAIARVMNNTKGLKTADSDIEIVGLSSSPNLERIIQLKPDLLIMGNWNSRYFNFFKNNNIPYINLNYKSFEEYLYCLKIYTSLNNRLDLYKKHGIEVGMKIQKIIKKIPNKKNPSVLLLFAGAKSVRARTSKSFVGAILKDLKVKNIAENSLLTESEMQYFSLEKIVSKNPDFILVQVMGSISAVKKRMIKDVENNPAWNTLKAVKNKKYLLLPKDLFLFKPNTRYADAYMYLAKLLYPEIFENKGLKK